MSRYYQASAERNHYQKINDDLEMDPLEIAALESGESSDRFTFTEDQRRWSVLDKLNRHYGHYHLNDPNTFWKCFNRRCLLATAMLAIFISLIVLFFKINPLRLQHLWSHLRKKQY